MYETIIKENLISKEEIDLLCSSFDKLEFSLNPSAEEDSYSSLHSYSVDHKYIHYDLIQNLDNQLIKNIQYFYKCNVKSFTGRCIVKYTENQYINIHKDWEPTDEWVVKNKKETVHLSSVFYFNEDYVGGELLFHNKIDNKIASTSIKPESGSVIFFDALKIHSTNPIVSGIKYSYTNLYTLGE